jgi:hypothetical protein
MQEVQLGMTPAGMAIRPRLNVPDTRHNRGGVYYTAIRFTADQAAPIIAAIDAEMQLAFGIAKQKAKSERAADKVKLASAPYRIDEDGSGVEIKFKLKATTRGMNGLPKKRAPAIYAANAERNQKLEIAHGDTIKATYRIVSYFGGAVGAGVTLELHAVQVIRQATAWVRNASWYGFSDASADATVTV